MDAVEEVEAAFVAARVYACGGEVCGGLGGQLEGCDVCGGGG